MNEQAERGAPPTTVRLDTSELAGVLSEFLRSMRQAGTFAPPQVNGRTSVPLAAVWILVTSMLGGLATVLVMFWQIGDNLRTTYLSRETFTTKMDAVQVQLQAIEGIRTRQDTLLLQFAELKASVEALRQSEKNR